MGLPRDLIRKLGEKIGPEVQLRRHALAKSKHRVIAGPFKGMHYVTEAFCSVLAPKLLGTYERELYPFIESVLADDHDAIIDIGAAEGYFAVGFALRSRGRVVAYEMDPKAQNLMRELARRNSVDHRIDIRDGCDPPEMEAVLSETQRPFVLCDVEGYEATLLDPRCVPSLKKATMLVELHELDRPGITAEIMRRLDPTHEIEIFWETPRTAADYPFDPIWARMLSDKYRSRVMSEKRGGKQAWLWMTPRQPPVSTVGLTAEAA